MDLLQRPEALSHLLSQVDDEPRYTREDHAERASEKDVNLCSSVSQECRHVADGWTLLELLFDITAALLALLFFALGVLALLADGKSANDVTYAQDLISASRLGPTIFPILFAVVAGRLMKACAAWKVENGASVRTIEQLLGSRTIFSTLSTQVSLRAFNVLGLFLVSLWALSPLGGQATLRTVTLESFPSATSSEVSYLDFTSTFSDYASMWSSNGPMTTAVFVASLAGGSGIKQSPQDMWGNTKVPILELLSSYSSENLTKWSVIDTTIDTTYSSLVGLPVATIAPRTNTSFSLETAYWHLDCGAINYDDSVEFYDNATQSYNLYSTTLVVPPTWCLVSNGKLFQIATDISRSAYTGTNASELPTGPRVVMFAARDTNGSVYQTKCSLTTTYVELNISCVEKTCGANAIRPSTLPHNTSSWSTLDFSSSYVPELFFGRFVNATGTDRYDTSSATENYFVNPDDPFALNAAWPDFSTLTSQEFSIRFAQLLNTYWLANIGASAIIGSFLTSPGFNGNEGYFARNTTGQVLRPRTVLVCHKTWLVILFAASAVLFFCGLAATVFGLLRRGPDILENFSTLTRDNPFISGDFPAGGSTVDGTEKARHLKHFKVWLGDVAVDKDIGHIAIGNQNVGRLTRGRLYD